MIRYLSYVGPKNEKLIEVAGRKIIKFKKGVAVDVLEGGMTQDYAKDLLRSGLFRLHGEKSVPFDEGLVCPCGFRAKSKAGLAAHKRFCGPCIQTTSRTEKS